MPNGRAQSVLQYLRALVQDDAPGVPDDEVLGLVIEHRDERAFAALERASQRG